MKLVNRGYSESVDFNKFDMKKILLSILFFVGVVSLGIGQSTGDFQTRQSGNWNDSDTWEEWTGSSWDNTANTPTSANGVISILDTHIVTVTANISVDQTFVRSGGQITINSGVTLTVAAGAGDDLTSENSSTISNNGTISIQNVPVPPPPKVGLIRILGQFIQLANGDISNSSNSTLIFGSGSEYIHNRNSGNIPVASWNANSTVTVTGVTNGIPSNINQTFGHFTWDCPSQNAFIDFQGLLTNINGTLSILDNAFQGIYLATGTDYTLNIGGDLIVSGGTSYFGFNSGNLGNINIGGDLEFSNGSYIDFSFSGDINLDVSGNVDISNSTLNVAYGGSSIVSILVDQDFSFTNSTVGNLSTNNGLIQFTGTSTQNISGIVDFENFNFEVSGSSSLSIPDGSALRGTSGTTNFILNTGASLLMGSSSPSGVLQNNTSSGAIRVSGTKNFNSGSKLGFIGNSIQYFGNDFPSTGVDIIINNTGDGVNMDGDLTISSGRTLTLTEGTLNIGDGNLLTLNGSVSTTNGGLSGGPLSNLTIGGTGAFGTLGFVGTQELNDFTLNRTSGGSVTLGGDLLINGTFDQTAGNLILNGNTFTLSGPYSRTAGSLVPDAAASLIINGTGALPSPTSFSGDINTLTLNRASTTFDVGGSSFTAGNINLFSGELTGSAISIADGGNVERQSSGVLTNELTTVGTYNLLYNNDVTINSGAELSTDPTAIANLQKDGTGNIDIQNDFTVNGTLTFTNGIFNAGTNTISLNGDLITNAGSTLANATITFDGTTNLSGSSIPTFGDITVNGTFNPTSSLNVNGDITNNGNLNSSAGTLTINATSQLGGTNPITVNNLTIGASGNVTASSSQALQIDGNLTNNGSFAANGGTVIFGGATSISGSVPDFANVQINGTLNAPASIAIGEDFINNGTFNHNNGEVRLISGATKNIAGTNATSFFDLAVEGGTVTINGTVDLENVMTFANNPTVDFDGSGSGIFTLRSTATRDAAIGDIGGSTISGSITAERYITGGTGASSYHYMGSPIATTISDWQNEFYVTGNFTGASTGPGINSSTPSIYIYDESAGGGINDKWVAYPTTDNTAPVELGVGYAVSLRDEQETITANTIGQFHTGQATWNVTDQGGIDDGWNLISNQFPSAIDFDAAGWDKSNIENGFYVYDPVAGNQYYSSGGGSSAGMDQYIAMGQAFWVQATANGTVTAQESVKYTGGTPEFFRENPKEKIKIIFEGNGRKDDSFIIFNPEATDAYDPRHDFSNLRNDQHNISTLTTDAKDLKVNHMASLNEENKCGKSVPLFVRSNTTGQFSLKFEELNSIQMSESIYLIDNFNNEVIEIKEGSVYNFEVTADVASKGSDRFELSFETKIPKNIESITSDICPGQNGEIQLKSTENFANYLVYKNDEVIGSAEGNGNNLNIEIQSEYLSNDLNDFTIKSFIGGCDTVSVGSAQIKITEALSLDNKVTGSSICKVETQAPFSIATQINANYYILHNEDTIQSVKGTGNQYDGIIASENLNDGLNEFVIAVDKDGCQNGTLEQVLEINVENLSIDRTVSFEVDDICNNSEANINFMSQADVEYKFYKNDKLVNSLIGDGGNQSITIPSEFISVGNNEYSVMAYIGNCSEYEFAEKISLNVEESIQSDLNIVTENTCGLQNVSVLIENAQKAKTYNLLNGGEIVFSATANEDGELLITLDSSKLDMGINQFNILIEGEYCQATEAKQTVEFELYEDAVIKDIENQSICLNDNTTIEISTNVGMSSYLLYVGEELISDSQSNLIELSPKETTTYRLTGVPENGCEVNSVNFIIEVTDLAVPGILVSGNVLESSIAGDSYQWFIDGNILEDQTGKVMVAKVSGDYTVEVSKGNCSNLSDAFTFNEEVLNANKVLEKALKLYPNPVVDKMFIELNDINSVDITIFTITGKFIDSFVLNSGQSEIDMAKFSKGTYLIQIKSDKGIVTKRIIKQ
jgi:hypothetical protein